MVRINTVGLCSLVISDTGESRTTLGVKQEVNGE